VGEDLSPAEMRELQRHLQDCANCQQAWRQHQRGFAVLQHSRTNESPPKSDSVWPTVVNRLRERAAAPQLGEFNGWVAALAVTAACVLLFVFSLDDSITVASRSPHSSFNDNRPVLSPNNSGMIKRPFLPLDGVQTKPPFNAAPEADEAQSHPE